MKKTLAAIVAFFVFVINSNVVFAQNEAVELRPSCGGPFDKCGFVRVEGSEWKEEIIPKQYEAVLAFSEGLAGVRIKGRWGFINMKGDLVIAPQFDLVGSFAYDLAEVLIDGKTGVINRQGDLVIQPQFARAIPFSKDVVIVKPGDWRSGYFRGHEKLPNIKNDSSLTSGPYGLYAIHTGWITKPEWEFNVFDHTGKASLIWAKKNRGSFYGLMRLDGSWLVGPKYDHVQTLHDERAVVALRKLWGAVDQEGQLVIPLRFGWLSYWHNGFALAKDPETQKEGLIDKAGNLVGGRFFDKASRGQNGIGEVMIGRLWHGIDQQGNIVAHPRENEVVKECPSGLKLVYISGKLQFVDQRGKPTVPYLLDAIMDHRFDCNGITSVEHKGKWGYVDRQGRLLFNPPKFDNQYDFEDGHAVVQKTNKWGIINERGAFTVKPIYDELRSAGKNIFKATLADKEFWINNEGVKQAEPADLKKEPINRAPYLACSGGLKIIPNNAQGDLWGMADENNNIIVEPLYRAIHCFLQGVAWVPNDDKREWCPFDSDGNLQDYPKCVTSRYPYEASHHYPEQLADDRYESSVLWSRAFLEFGAGLREEPPQMIGDGIMSNVSSSRIR